MKQITLVASSLFLMCFYSCKKPTDSVNPTGELNPLDHARDFTETEIHTSDNGYLVFFRQNNL